MKENEGVPTELAPCPFCGADIVPGRREQGKHRVWVHPSYYTLAKDDCVMSAYQVPEGAIAAWNRRTAGHRRSCPPLSRPPSRGWLHVS